MTNKRNIPLNCTLSGFSLTTYAHISILDSYTAAFSTVSPKLIIAKSSSPSGLAEQLRLVRLWLDQVSSLFAKIFYL